MYQNVLYVRTDLKIEVNNKKAIYNKINHDFNDRIAKCDGYYADWFGIGNECSAPHNHNFFKVKPGSQSISCYLDKDKSRLVENQRRCDIANIQDLDMKIKYEKIPSIIYDDKDYILTWSKGRIQTYIGEPLNDKEFIEIIDNINNKKIKGVVAFINMHGS